MPTRTPTKPATPPAPRKAAAPRAVPSPTTDGAPPLRSRPPRNVAPWPLVLVEGEEGSGKTTLPILLTRDDRVGRGYLLDLGEGSAEEYGLYPGVDFHLIEHDGTYADVYGQLLAVRAEAERAKAAGEPPPVLMIDTVSDLWDGLKDWTTARASLSDRNREKRASDPHAEIDVPRNLWNDTASRYRRLMTTCLTFPGPVVMIARGKEVSATDPNTGQPYRDGRRTWSVEAHRTLTADCTVWLRMRREVPPQIIKARSVHAPVRPGRDAAVIVDERDDLLAWLIFDVLKVDPSEAGVRDVRHLVGGDLTPEERAAQQVQPGPTGAPSRPATADEIADAIDRMGEGQTVDDLTVVYEALRARGWLNVTDPNGTTLLQHLTARKLEIVELAKARAAAEAAAADAPPGAPAPNGPTPASPGADDVPTPQNGAQGREGVQAP
jgi:hypothetical protein